MKLPKHPLYIKLLKGLLLDICRNVVNITGDVSVPWLLLQLKANCRRIWLT